MHYLFQSHVYIPTENHFILYNRNTLKKSWFCWVGEGFQFGLPLAPRLLYKQMKYPIPEMLTTYGMKWKKKSCVKINGQGRVSDLCWKLLSVTL